jgi:uncharacterized protein (DUF2336 family)
MSKRPAEPRLDGLFDLALRDGVDIRPTLLRVLTDLYVQKPFHTQEEETQYLELATGLIDAVDEATRAIVAARLRDYPGTPAAVWKKLTASERAFLKNDDLSELFFSADSHERRLILANLVAREKHSTLRVSSETLARLEASALQRNASEFTRLLRATLGIAPQLALRIVQDPSGEPLVVACKALGMPAPALQRILLLLNPAIGQSVGRVYELARLFDDMSLEAALQMLSIWRASAPARTILHEPATVHDDKRSAREFANPSARRVASPPLVPAKAGTQRASATPKGPAGFPRSRE